MKRNILNRTKWCGALFCLLTACSPGEHEAPKIAESQRAALDKAKALESTLNQEAAEQKKKIEQQSE